MNWILRFFSNEAQINHLLKQLESASRAVVAVTAKLEQELNELETYYNDTRTTLAGRRATADRVAKILSALN